MQITKKTAKNQVTIPKQIAAKFAGVDYFEVLSNESAIILRPVKPGEGESRLSEIRDKMARLGIRKRDIAEAVRWARKK